MADNNKNEEKINILELSKQLKEEEKLFIKLEEDYQNVKGDIEEQARHGVGILMSTEGIPTRIYRLDVLGCPSGEITVILSFYRTQR